MSTLLKYTLMIRETASTYWFGGYDFNQFFGYHFSQVQLRTHRIQVCYIYLYILIWTSTIHVGKYNSDGQFFGPKTMQLPFFHAGIGAIITLVEDQDTFTSTREGWSALWWRWRCEVVFATWAMKIKPGWLGYTRDYSTQLYRDYNKPLSRSLLTKQYNGK